MSKLENLKKSFDELKVVGMEIVTSLLHLSVAVPKALLIVSNLFLQLDTLDDWKVLLDEFLAKFRSKTKSLKV